MTLPCPCLSWLSDAPVFIDGQQVGVFYDAFKTVELQGFVQRGGAAREVH
jgi:hypothetical protein